ncbi:MAG: methyltransferase [Paraprevotella sp.]|jgi:ribosomal protein L11 methyltransferase (prmA)|nr:methyltransferase [Paraprevotella sp.]
MNREYFQFKQFVVYQELCAMKVGTDGVLLGSWFHVPDEGNVLDIGTGTGLIALMAAQRSPHANIMGIDIDAGAVEQARRNAGATAWSTRLRFQQADAAIFTSDVRYDSIVCNPPFFTRSLQGPDARRNQARHAESLPFLSLIGAVKILLADKGTFNVILPVEKGDEFTQMCWENNLNICRKCTVYPKVRKPAKRVMLSFTRERASYPREERLFIIDENGDYTLEYKQLTGEFYLKI